MSGGRAAVCMHQDTRRTHLLHAAHHLLDRALQPAHGRPRVTVVIMSSRSGSRARIPGPFSCCTCCRPRPHVHRRVPLHQVHPAGQRGPPFLLVLIPERERRYPRAQAPVVLRVLVVGRAAVIGRSHRVHLSGLAGEVPSEIVRATHTRTVTVRTSNATRAPKLSNTNASPGDTACPSSTSFSRAAQNCCCCAVEPLSPVVPCAGSTGRSWTRVAGWMAVRGRREERRMTGRAALELGAGNCPKSRGCAPRAWVVGAWD